MRSSHPKNFLCFFPNCFAIFQKYNLKTYFRNLFAFPNNIIRSVLLIFSNISQPKITVDVIFDQIFTDKIYLKDSKGTNPTLNDLLFNAIMKIYVIVSYSQIKLLLRLINKFLFCRLFAF